MSGSPFPAEVVEAVVEAIRAGETSISISKRLGVSRTTINRINRRYGFERRPVGARPQVVIRPEQWAAMVERVAAGASLADVAKAAGVHRSRLRWHCHKQGVHSVHAWTKPMPEARARAREMRAAGEKLEYIAAVLNVHADTASNWTRA